MLGLSSRVFFGLVFFDLVTCSLKLALDEVRFLELQFEQD